MFIKIKEPVKKALHDIVQPAMFFLFGVRLQETAAEHRSQGKGYDTGDEDRNGNGNGKFVQHSSKHSRHEENRKADLFGPDICCILRRFTALDMPDDVFQHDYGIVDNKSDGKGQRHQGDVVYREAESVHRGKGPDDRKREGKARDYCCRYVSEEKENDHDNQGNSQKKGELDIRNRLADRLGTVKKYVQVNRCRERVPEGRDLFFD